MNQSKISRRKFQGSLVSVGAQLVGAGAIMSAVGCDPNSDQQTNSTTTSAPEAASEIPLRIWIQGRVNNIEIISRQWKAASEQPIDIQVLSADELLQREQCKCDVLLFQSRLLGELIKRQWITKLPSSLSTLLSPPAEAGPASDDEQSTLPPPAAVEAASYDGTIYSLPLGVTLLSLLGSSATEVSTTTWDKLSEQLASVEIKPIDIDAAQVDSDALVDRFLSIAMTVTPVNTKYGVLFEIRDMQSRLMSPEFQTAADLIQRLACQPEAGLSVFGSHTDAWKWINTCQTPAFALVAASEVDESSGMLDAARPISVDPSRQWNCGSGLLASIAMQCQQSKQAARFTQWISSPTAVQNLKLQVHGISSFRAGGRTLIDRLNSSKITSLHASNLLTEPRMPGAHLYRQALAVQLIQMLAGKVDREAALQAAAQAWNQLSAKDVAALKDDYERSLDLKL